MDIDRQAIERRDFPIARRGYDPAAVDAHLRVLANEIEELQSELSDGGRGSSLAATAGTQVQSILAAAEATAAELEREALDDAKTTRGEAARDAASTREKAIAQARGQVAFVAQATAALLERVNAMDAEVGTLVESVRAGAGRLSADLGAVEESMEELYDAASGRGDSPAAPVPTDAPAPAPPPPAPAHTSAPAPAAGNGDLDGARLTALNMALNGESRAEADRVLAENFQVPDRMALIDEVYASIET